MAGAGGFEPPNAATKKRCLTTWLRPNNSYSPLFSLRIAECNDYINLVTQVHQLEC